MGSTMDRKYYNFMIARGKSDGTFYTIFQELKQEDAERFRGYVRSNTTSFEKLVELLAPSSLKKDTVLRECIKPEVLRSSQIFCEWRILSLSGVSVSN